MQKLTSVSGTVILLDREGGRFMRIQKPGRVNPYTSGLPTNQWMHFGTASEIEVGGNIFLNHLSGAMGYSWYESGTIESIEEVDAEEYPQYDRQRRNTP